LKQVPGHVSPLQQDGDRLLVDRDDYTPWVLEEWRNRADESKISMLRFPAPLELVLVSFEATFGSARIVRVEPLTGVQRQYGVTVVTSAAGTKEYFERLQQTHRKLISFVSALRGCLQRGECEAVSVEQAECGLHIRRDGHPIQTTMAQDRVLATLAFYGVGNWFTMEQFCTFYYGPNFGATKGSFGTAVSYVIEELPTLSWNKKTGGWRQASGIIIECSMKPEELEAFVKDNRDKRKPARKKSQKKAGSKQKKARKLLRGKTGKSGKPGK
jgi:hypothetical protein